MEIDLEPLDPATAKQMYLEDREHELAPATLQAHHYRLKQFVAWCEAEDIENLNDFTGRDIHRYRVKRNADGLTTASMRCQLATLRVFLRFLATIDAVQPGLDEKILLPSASDTNARDELLEPEQAKQILAYLKQYRYATLEHALLEVLWHLGLRIGATISIDVDDYNPEDAYLAIRHRPRRGTTLKKNIASERLVALSPRVCQILDDWLDVNHPQESDDHERMPLFGTSQGRLSVNRGRTIAYQYTRPCIYSSDCPENRNPETCEAAPTEMAYACPAAISPHPIRRGAITYHLQSGTPEKVVSDRMDVGTDVLDKHYDQRTEEEKLHQRRRYLPEDNEPE